MVVRVEPFYFCQFVFKEAEAPITQSQERSQLSYLHATRRRTKQMTQGRRRMDGRSIAVSSLSTIVEGGGAIMLVPFLVCVRFTDIIIISGFICTKTVRIDIRHDSSNSFQVPASADSFSSGKKQRYTPRHRRRQLGQVLQLKSSLRIPSA